MLQLKKTEGHIQQLSSVCAGTAFDGPISSKKIKCKETAVENLLKSKYLTNWEVEKNQSNVSCFSGATKTQ